MTSDLISATETADERLAAASDVEKQGGAAAFYPPRHVTGALLKKMGWEFIRPDGIKLQWKIIHKEKRHENT